MFILIVRYLGWLGFCILDVLHTCLQAMGLQRYRHQPCLHRYQWI